MGEPPLGAMVGSFSLHHSRLGTGARHAQGGGSAMYDGQLASLLPEARGVTASAPAPPVSSAAEFMATSAALLAAAGTNTAAGLDVVAAAAIPTVTADAETRGI